MKLDPQLIDPARGPVLVSAALPGAPAGSGHEFLMALGAAGPDDAPAPEQPVTDAVCPKVAVGKTLAPKVAQPGGPAAPAPAVAPAAVAPSPAPVPGPSAPVAGEDPPATGHSAETPQDKPRGSPKTAKDRPGPATPTRKGHGTDIAIAASVAAIQAAHVAASPARVMPDKATAGGEGTGANGAGPVTAPRPAAPGAGRKPGPNRPAHQDGAAFSGPPKTEGGEIRLAGAGPRGHATGSGRTDGAGPELARAGTEGALQAVSRGLRPGASGLARPKTDLGRHGTASAATPDRPKIAAAGGTVPSASAAARLTAPHPGRAAGVQPAAHEMAVHPANGLASGPTRGPTRGPTHGAAQDPAPAGAEAPRRDAHPGQTFAATGSLVPGAQGPVQAA